jgi:hypothetical protein
MNDPAAGLSILGLAFFRAALFLAAMFLLGTRLLPALLKRIACLGSRELFILAITAIGLGVGYITYLFGLSFAFGAFIAGMVLSESDYGHQALSDIVPLRDLFGLLFFASVGMLLDPGYLVHNFWLILLLVVAVSIGKGPASTPIPSAGGVISRSWPQPPWKRLLVGARHIRIGSSMWRSWRRWRGMRCVRIACSCARRRASSTTSATRRPWRRLPR